MLYFLAEIFCLGFLVKWSEVTQSCPTLCDPLDCIVACQASLSMEFSRQEYWSGYYLAILPNVNPYRFCLKTQANGHLKSSALERQGMIIFALVTLQDLAITFLEPRGKSNQSHFQNCLMKRSCSYCFSEPSTGGPTPLVPLQGPPWANDHVYPNMLLGFYSQYLSRGHNPPGATYPASEDT